MITRREAMLAALKTRLETIINVAPDLQVTRNSRLPVKHARSLVLRDGGQSTNSDQTEFKMHTARPTIEGYVTAGSDDEIGPAINAFYGLVIDALEADVSLDGAATDVREVGFDTQLDESADSKQAAGWFALSIEVDYTSLRVDSSQP